MKMFHDHKCLMDILSGKLFYNYSVNKTAERVSLPKSLIVASASRDLTSIIHAQDYESQMLKNEFPIPMQCDKFYSYPTDISVRYTPPKPGYDQVDCNNAVRQ